MSAWQIFKVSRKTFIDPLSWLTVDNLTTATRTTWGLISALFVPATPLREETFEQAMQRLGLSEEALKSTRTNYLIFTAIFLLCGIATFILSIYLLWVHVAFHGWILGMVTSALFFVQAFRCHFWYFQIKHRKLGCTVEEWWRGKPFDEVKND